MEPSVMPLFGKRSRDAILSSVQHPDQVGSAVRRDAPRVPSRKAPLGALFTFMSVLQAITSALFTGGRRRVLPR